MKWPIELVKGSAYEEFGRHASAQAGRKLALLCDGPKGWPAISMLAAATSESVHVVALHNLIVGCQERRYLQELGGGSHIFYETAILAPDRAGKSCGNGNFRGPRRRGPRVFREETSLGVLVFDEACRSKFRGAWRPGFGILHQPAVVRTLWASGMYAAATKPLWAFLPDIGALAARRQGKNRPVRGGWPDVFLQSLIYAGQTDGVNNFSEIPELKWWVAQVRDILLPRLNPFTTDHSAMRVV
ncbi:hypothetical protein [Bradyrhizobium sp. RDT46]|uniref:hypothetical protein n=1 Tax=Bradyrhizobium sp. RDT46 TaxID=3341829 RepID=UPI0035C6FEDB